MTEYLIVNTLISSWALLVSHYLVNDARHMFNILVFALICWIVPIGLIEFSTDITIVSQVKPMLNNFQQPVSALITHPTMAFSWLQLFIILLCFGVLRFVVDLIQHHKQHQYFKSQSKPTNQGNIYTIKNLNNACVTGFKPSIIWVDESLYYSELNDSILAHEQQHIIQGDPYWMMVITCLERLFWFNPLVFLLAKQSKLTMELKCDQACKNQMSEGKYQHHMAKILLKMQQKKPSLNNYMAQSNKNHIHRIKQLSKETTMKMQYKWLLALSFTVTTWLSAGVLADAQAPEIKQNQIFLELKLGINNQEAKNMSLLIENGKEASVKYGNYTFAFLPQIINSDTKHNIPLPPSEPGKTIKADEKPQILTSISVSQSSKSSTDTELSNMALMSKNNTWASFIIGKTDVNEEISAELRVTTISQTDP